MYYNMQFEIKRKETRKMFTVSNIEFGLMTIIVVCVVIYCSMAPTLDLEKKEEEKTT